MKRQPIIGVMGGAAVEPEVVKAAYTLGRLIAENGWVLLNGGRNAGVMAASSQGAADHGGLTVGILPDADTSQAARHIQIPICTGMGSARNTINVLSSDIVVACTGSAGTISEIALALKHGKTVITLDFDTGHLFSRYQESGRLIAATTPEEVIKAIRHFFAGSGNLKPPIS